MTTQTRSGFPVAPNADGDAVALAPATMQMTTFGSFFLRDTLDNPVADDCSSITFVRTTGRLQSGIFPGAGHVSLDDDMSAGEMSWIDGGRASCRTMLMRVEGATVAGTHWFVMACAALPAFATSADCDALRTAAGVTSIITSTPSPARATMSSTA